MLTNDSSLTRPSFTLPAVFRISALAIFAGASTLALHAQNVEPKAQPSQLVADLTNTPPSLAALAGATYSMSSSSLDTPVDPASTEVTFAGMQPPPRRRYGRPRYNDSSHNPDGSSKYTFVLGAGFTGPVGNTYHYLNTNYGIQVGGGRNFNKNFGVLVQFDYDRFGFNGRTLTNQASIYNSPYVYGAGSVTGLDGSSHVWSFSLNPIYNFVQGQSWGAYAVGAVGFYHKTANFTIPAQGEYCDYYYGCYSYSANETIDKYTSNAPGFNGGFGITYKPSRFAGERLFVEARYVFVDNQHRPGFTVNNASGITATSTNLYPANSNRTTYTVYKAGIRF